MTLGSPCRAYNRLPMSTSAPSHPTYFIGRRNGLRSVGTLTLDVPRTHLFIRWHLVEDCSTNFAPAPENHESTSETSERLVMMQWGCSAGKKTSTSHNVITSMQTISETGRRLTTWTTAGHLDNGKSEHTIGIECAPDLSLWSSWSKEDMWSRLLWAAAFRTDCYRLYLK